ncbi:hypothetical protein BDN72DRAFT_808180 [Pluteus cervinus]|uniref:Uncharacterized protein n=1 Tax=Pluteus cervinus TaxID=181527 RepID=A0ACD3BIF5_9AGAR|nr:hypothetical protein BDN72DRAFT_808180 [Pluteus cervinus]
MFALAPWVKHYRHNGSPSLVRLVQYSQLRGYQIYLQSIIVPRRGHRIVRPFALCTARSIWVKVVGPGPVVTAIQPALRTAEGKEGFGVGMPLHGRPAQLGPSFVFLASSDSNNDRQSFTPTVSPVPFASVN